MPALTRATRPASTFWNARAPQYGGHKRPEPRLRPHHTTVHTRNFFEMPPPIIIAAQAQAPSPPPKLKPKMVSVGCQAGASQMPLVVQQTWLQRAWANMVALSGVVAQLAQCCTPRVTVAVGVYPSWPDHWPSFMHRR